MRKKISLFLLFILLPAVLFLGGCWDNRELDAISIVTGVGIDATSDADKQKYILQIQKAQPTSGAGSMKGGSKNGKSESSGGATFLLTDENNGLISAISDLRKSSTRDIYLSHNQILLFGRERAKENILPDIDAFIREHEMRMEIWVLMADDTAEKVLKTTLPQETNAAIGLSRMMYDEEIYTKSWSVNLLDFMTKLHSKSTAAVMPIIAVRETENEEYFQIIGLAVFGQSCRMEGQMDIELVRGYSWAHGDYKKAFLNVSNDIGSFTVMVDNIRTKRKSVLSSNGIPGLEIKIQGKFSISEIKGFEGMTPEEIAPIVEQMTNDAIEEKIQNTLRYSQSINCDIFEIGSMCYKYHPEKWKSIEPRWNDVYPRTFIQADSEIKFISTGKANFSLEMKDPNDE
jgi:spore germination protein KC